MTRQLNVMTAAQNTELIRCWLRKADADFVIWSKKQVLRLMCLVELTAGSPFNYPSAKTVAIKVRSLAFELRIAFGSRKMR